MGAAIVVMELVALLVAVLAFGWPVLLVGAPLFVGTLVALAVFRLWEFVQRGVERRRAARWEPTGAMTGGLMSGFFEVSAIADQPPMPPVAMRMLQVARDWHRGSRPGPIAGVRCPSGPHRTVQRVRDLSDRLPSRVRALGGRLSRR